MRRLGFTFIEVIQAVIVMAIGLTGTFLLLGALYEQLSPQGPWGGLRRYIHGEELLRAQAEGLRVLRTISPVPASNQVVIPDPGTGYGLSLVMSRAPVVARYGSDGRASGQQMFYIDVIVRHQGRAIGTISLSTLRSEVMGQYEKIGL